MQTLRILARVGAGLATGAVLLVAPATAYALDPVDYVWSGASTTSMSTSDPANWDGPAGPGSGDNILVEGGFDMVVDGAPLLAHEITVSPAMDFGLSGLPITVSTGFLVAQPTGYATSIGNDITFGPDPSGTRPSFIYVQPTNTLFVTAPTTIVDQLLVLGGGDVLLSQVTGGSISMRSVGTLEIQGGGSLTALDIEDGTVHSNAVIDAPITANAGTVSGASTSATPGAVGTFAATEPSLAQRVASILLHRGSALSPGIVAGGAGSGAYFVDGDLTGDPGSTLRLDIGVSSDSSDSVTVGGTARIDGMVLRPSLLAGSTSGGSATVLRAASIDGLFADPMTGARLGDGSVFENAGRLWRVAMTATTAGLTDLGPRPATAPSSPALAETGVDAPWLAAGGFVASGLALLGSALLVGRRGRRATPPQL